MRAHWPARCACQPRPGRKKMVAESAVSGTTRVTTPRNWRAENTGLNIDRMSSGARGVVSRDAARASLRSRIIYQAYVRLRHNSSPKAYDLPEETISAQQLFGTRYGRFARRAPRLSR